MAYQIITDGEIVLQNKHKGLKIPFLPKCGVILFIFGKLVSFLSDTLGDFLLALSLGAFSLFLLMDLLFSLFRIEEDKSPRPPIIFFPIPFGLFYLVMKPLFKSLLSLFEQCGTFLTTGEWKSYSAIDFIRSFGAPENLTAWAVNPDQLIGIHKIIQIFNGNLIGTLFYIAIVLLGAVPLYVWSNKYQWPD